MRSAPRRRRPLRGGRTSAGRSASGRPCPRSVPPQVGGGAPGRPRCAPYGRPRRPRCPGTGARPGPQAPPGPRRRPSTPGRPPPRRLPPPASAPGFGPRLRPPASAPGSGPRPASTRPSCPVDGVRSRPCGPLGAARRLSGCHERPLGAQVRPDRPPPRPAAARSPTGRRAAAPSVNARRGGWRPLRDPRHPTPPHPAQFPPAHCVRGPMAAHAHDGFWIFGIENWKSRDPWRDRQGRGRPRARAWERWDPRDRDPRWGPARRA